MSRKRQILKILYFCVILILVLVMIISGLQILELTSFSDEQPQGGEIVSKTITRDGVDYYPRQDITVVMVLGIDEFGPVQDSGSYNNPGAADMIALLIFDDTQDTCNVLCLNRDTMLEMPVLGINGRPAGTYYGQLALAHTYGSGLKDSCENTRKTVSDFLYGIRIDYYVSMNMDAIGILNDAVGGVTVTVTDDFSNVDPTIKEGEITLYGDQAINFVRTRGGVGDQLNVSRIRRQKEYINGFLEAFREQNSADSQIILDAYEQVSPYIVTDCSGTTMSNLISRYADHRLEELYLPEGENVQGEEYYEFYVDEEKLDALILKLFYAPKK